MAFAVAREMIRKFLVQRWKIIFAILACIYSLAIFGLPISALIPGIGTIFFMAALMIWYVPGILFEWTGHFRLHEFGASPEAWQGHVIMFLFYFILAALISIPFKRDRRAKGIDQ